jgi:hypothetical protein
MWQNINDKKEKKNQSDPMAKGCGSYFESFAK